MWSRRNRTPSVSLRRSSLRGLLVASPLVYQFVTLHRAANVAICVTNNLVEFVWLWTWNLLSNYKDLPQFKLLEHDYFLFWSAKVKWEFKGRCFDAVEQVWSNYFILPLISSTSSYTPQEFGEEDPERRSSVATLRRQCPYSDDDFQQPVKRLQNCWIRYINPYHSSGVSESPMKIAVPFTILFTLLNMLVFNQLLHI